MKTKIETESRSGLYFDKWQYSIAFHQSRVSDIRGLDVDRMRESIAYRRTSFYLRGNYSEEVIANLYTTLDVLKAETDIKLTLSGDWCNVYTNDITILKRLKNKCPYINMRYVKQAIVDEPKDVVLLNSADYSFRTYFRAQWVDEIKLEQLENFFKAQQEHIKPCASLKYFVASNKQFNKHWMASHYFVDYNDPGYQLMLELILPRAARKTMPIVKRINN